MDLAKEARALESLTRLLKAADECRGLFDEAGMEYPAPLRRMLGERDASEHSDSTVRSAPGAIRIPPPNVNRPQGVADGWIYVPLSAMTPQTMVMGVLRDATAPVPVKQVVSAVKGKIGNVSEGSIANIGTRLAKDKAIVRSEDGWALVDKARAPILNGRHAWGTPAMFQKQELAARRREAILHILGLFPAGLMTMQLLERLESCAWLKTPLNKDLLKADMEELGREEKVKRKGNTKKWVLATEEA